jgi:hypothetical protein
MHMQRHDKSVGIAVFSGITIGMILIKITNESRNTLFDKSDQNHLAKIEFKSKPQTNLNHS